MEVDDIISYHDLVTEERAALQKGMNYGGVGKKCRYSVFLMSVREGAPYADALDAVSGMLTYRRLVTQRRTAAERRSRSEDVGPAVNDSERILDGEWQILPGRDGFQKRSAREAGADQSL